MTAPLATIAGSIARSIAAATLDADAVAALHSDAGLDIDGATVWHRTEDDRVVACRSTSRGDLCYLARVSDEGDE